MVGIVESVEDMTDAVADAGADRPGARDRLPQALRRASAASIRAENAHLDMQLALMPDDNPYAYMLNSNIALNEAMLATSTAETFPSAKAAASAIRSRAAEARRAARQIPSAVEATTRALEAQEPALAARQRAAYASMGESSQVELQMADAFDEAADALEQGPDQAKLEAAMGRLPGAAKRRNDLHQAQLESVSR